MSQAIHHEVVFKAHPERVYRALAESQQHSAFTGGAPADISGETGGAWTAYGGHIGGRNLELIPSKRIVQSWRAQDWPEGVHSVVHFELEPQGAETRLVFDQAGVPDDQREHIDQGWTTMYWEPLAKYLG